MAANKNSKLKLLCIQRMLEEETDADHGLSMAEIIQRLAESEKAFTVILRYFANLGWILKHISATQLSMRLSIGILRYRN